MTSAWMKTYETHSSLNFCENWKCSHSQQEEYHNQKFIIRQYLDTDSETGSIKWKALEYSKKRVTYIKLQYPPTSSNQNSGTGLAFKNCQPAVGENSMMLCGCRVHSKPNNDLETKKL